MNEAIDVKSSTQDESIISIQQWVTFSLDGEVYGINVLQVQEVLKYTEIAPVPGAPEYILGIINLRGNVVTVIDTRHRFGLAPVEDLDDTRIIIVEADSKVVGIMVDSVSEVIQLSPSDIDDPPNLTSTDSAKYFMGVVNSEDSLLVLVDLDRLLTDEEWASLVKSE